MKNTKKGLGNIALTFEEGLKIALEKNEQLQQEIYTNRKLEIEKGSYDPSFLTRRHEIRREQQKIELEVLNLKNIKKCFDNGGKLVEIHYKFDDSFIKNVPDFTSITTQNILFDEDTLLTDDVPPYIPEISMDVFKVKGYLFDAMKIGPDLYALATYGFKNNNADNLILVSLDQLVLIQDYYYTKVNAIEIDHAKQKTQRGIDAYFKLTIQKRTNFFEKSVSYASLPVAVRKKVIELEWKSLDLDGKEKLYIPMKTYKGKRIPAVLSNIEGNSMWASYHNMYEAFINPDAKPYVIPGKAVKGANEEVWDSWVEFRNVMKYKLLDIRTQRLILTDTRKLAIETSFGLSNTNPELHQQYGILVKRQNGTNINPAEIEQIRVAYEKVSTCFGSTIGFARLDTLKMVHTGNTNVFASKAIGAFIPSMKTISVSNKYGSQCFETTMAHEVAHYMDYLIGQQVNKRFASDNYDSTIGQISFQFRYWMNEQSDSDYINSTHECFARAMEQYFATENFGENVKIVFNQRNPIDSTPYFSERNYCPREKFNEVIKPLINKFLSEYKEIFSPLNIIEQKDFLINKTNKELSDKFVQIKLANAQFLLIRVRHKLALL